MVVLIHYSGQSIPLKRIRSARLLCKTSMVSPSRTETTGTVASQRLVSFLYDDLGTSRTR